MTHYLVATRSVHTTAAACDYLTAELSEGDAVTVLTVDDSDEDGDGNRDGGDEDRDGGDALNVAVARLSGLATVEQERREGDPGEVVLSTADAVDADRIVMGARHGEPGTARRVGRTAERVLADATVPVVVVPLPDL